MKLNRELRQMEVANLVKVVWGERGATDLTERVARVVEEVTELAQAEGVPIEYVLRIVRHVYSKVPGEPRLEAGAVGITLLAYCSAIGCSADELEQLELERVRAIPIEHLRQKHQAKADAGIAQSGTSKGAAS